MKMRPGIAKAAGGGTSFTYFKFDFTGAQDTTVLQIGELEMLIGATDQLPTMTDFTTSGVTISVSEYNSAVGPAWLVANNDANAQANSWQTSVGYPHWLKVQFPTAKAINGYSIQAVIGAGGQHIYTPKVWTLKGSNTGAFAGEETLLNSQSVANWTDGLKRTFNF